VKSLYLRIYLTVVAVLLLFALVAGWLFKRNIEHEQAQRVTAMSSERQAAWGELFANALPGADVPREAQAQGLEEWSQRLRMPLALDDAEGLRIAESQSFREALDEGPKRFWRMELNDGRTLWVLRGPPRTGQPRNTGWRRDTRVMTGTGEVRELPAPPASAFTPPWMLFEGAQGLLIALVLLFGAVSLGAYPVVRRLTRQLEALKRGVEAFGAGQLSHRVKVRGRDEVAAVAASFNRAAARIEDLLRSHKSLLANASHELRSPLARLKMAVSLMDTAAPESRAALKQEIESNIRELDALVEEVLLASRLDAAKALDRREPVDLLALAAEEGARVDAEIEGQSVVVHGDERLLRRALRNLLENARRYGGAEAPLVQVRTDGRLAQVQVCDRGPGVPEDQRERIFEAFYRLPGHAEYAGGVGLGLSLVRQIAQRHDGQVRCEPREGGGSCFSLRLPLGTAA
jgi:signal transduction histidine kinase